MTQLVVSCPKCGKEYILDMEVVDIDSIPDICGLLGVNRPDSYSFAGGVVCEECNGKLGAALTVTLMEYKNKNSEN